MSKDKKQINLLPKESEKLTRLKKWQKTARRASVILLAVYIFTLSLLAVTNFVFFQEKKELSKTNTALTKEVEGLRTREGMLKTLKTRVNLAKLVFTNSAAFPVEMIDDILATIQTNVGLTGINADAEKVILQGSTPDTTTLASFLAAAEDAGFKSVVLNVISKNEEGYTFSLDIK